MAQNRDASRQPTSRSPDSNAICHAILDMCLALISAATRCGCAGIRVKREGDYPLARSLGFSEKFIEQERSLLPGDLDRQLGEEQSPALLKCLCGRVIRGERCFREEMFTPNGTLWLNDLQDTDKIPASIKQEMRNGCLREGFQSLALVPCRPDDEVVALLLVCDRRRGLLSLRVVTVLEETGRHLAKLLFQLQELRKMGHQPHRAEEKQLQILVVDDEAEMASLVASMLEARGHQVATALSGLEALETLKETKFDLVITDFNMPAMSGLGLAEEIGTRWHPFAPPVVLMSGTSSEEMAPREKGSPDIAAFLAKPFSGEELMETVRAVSR